MQTNDTFYLPLTPAFFSILIILFVVLALLIQFRVLRYAYMQLGVSSRTAMFLLLSSLIGSYFNIPLFEIAGQTVSGPQVVQFFGMHYQVPAASGHAGTVVAVNVGGAVIPGCMSFYLLWHYKVALNGVSIPREEQNVCTY